MPDNRTDARGAPDGEPSPSGEHSPDLVGEELGDDARIWRVYDRVAREEDRERVANWNRGLDNLALFAGLFSAVTTAFIIESQQDTEPDYAQLTFLVLNASSAGVPFREEPFAIDPSVRLTNCLWISSRLTNCLWISSLMLSLTAALIAIMGKDWIGMYVSRPVCNPRQWAEIRTYRLGCVDRWYMSGVIASAPVLLHMSLILFAVGLVIFVAPDPFSQRVALALSLAAGALYFITVLSATVFPSSPFKSPATQAFRATVWALPLVQFQFYKWELGFTSRVAEDHATFGISLCRTLARFLSASQQLYNGHLPSPDGYHRPMLSALEHCMRCLHTQLCYYRTALPYDKRHETIELLLDNSALIRISSVWSRRGHGRTTEHGVLNILTVVARHLAGLLAHQESASTGARLFLLFSSSESTGPQGNPEVWDLGSYLREASSRPSEQDDGTELSMRRLLCALRSLRPLCVSYDDLRTAWDRICLVDDDGYADAFWDNEEFELDTLIELDEATDEHSATESTILQIAPNEELALYYLDAAMR